MTTTTKLKLKIVSWDESPYRELPDGSKFAKAEVVLAADEGDGTGSFDSLLYYRPDGTSSYVCLLQLADVVEGHAGSFVLAGSGGFDGTTAEFSATVVADSGTDELVGASGSVTSASTHADYPYMPLILEYELG